jgi:hypothetical protein
MRADFDADLVAIFFDTLGLAALFQNENEAAQIISVLSKFQEVSDATGALVILIDHMGKDDALGARGSSAKVDLPETVLECLGDRDARSGVLGNLRMRLRKIRDGEAGRVIPYRLHTVDMGRDEDGDPLTTCVVRWEPDRAMPTPKRPGRPRKVDGPLARAIEEVGMPADEEALRAAFYRHYGRSAKAANAAWHRALAAAAVRVANGRVEYVL